MKWDDYRQSDNVDDYRGGGGGGGGGLPGGATGGIGLGGLLLMGVLYFGFGIDPRFLLDTGLVGGGGGGQPRVERSQPRQVDPNDQLARFVSTVLATTEDAWTQIFREMGKTYEKPRLTLFSDEIPSGCGDAESAMGPFYCPNDRRVYLDMAFFDELAGKFHAPGEFANAYVIGHEVGHHVQNLLGILPRVQAAQRGRSREEANALQVRVELQADCFAGVWANRTNRIKQNFIDENDVAAAIRAAAAVGDDTIQRRTIGRVVPESFTHGSAKQRTAWFQQGLKAGKIEACNTFQSGSGS